MQTILVPFDFTTAAQHALLYANKLAAHLPAEVVLLHCGTPAPLLPAERAALLCRLEAAAERLRYQQLTRQEARRITYYFHLATEELADCLQVLVAGYCASLVVTSLALSDCASDTAAGRPPQCLPEQVSCPVLVVPPGRHELPQRVVVAGDFERLGSGQLASLPPLGRTPSVQFDLVQFYQELSGPTATSKLIVRLQKALSTAQQQLPSATTHLRPDDDALEGLSEFCAQQGADLLVLASANGCLVRRFFHPHYRQTHAYHLRIPALLLPLSTLPTSACCAECGLRQAAAVQLLAMQPG